MDYFRRHVAHAARTREIAHVLRYVATGSMLSWCWRSHWNMFQRGLILLALLLAFGTCSVGALSGNATERTCFYVCEGYGGAHRMSVSNCVAQCNPSSFCRNSRSFLSMCNDPSGASVAVVRGFLSPSNSYRTSNCFPSVFVQAIVEESVTLFRICERRCCSARGVTTGTSGPIRIGDMTISASASSEMGLSGGCGTLDRLIVAEANDVSINGYTLPFNTVVLISQRQGFFCTYEIDVTLG